MRPNKLKALLKEGRHPVQIALHHPDLLLTETIALMGFDAVRIDLQHGALDYDGLYRMLVAISRGESTPLVRVPWNDPATIMKALDAGVYGIVCPMLNTPQDVEKFVGACRYPPHGYRSLGPVRAGLESDYFAQANENVLTIAMIETKEAYENLEDIVRTPGLDALFIGPGDLTMSMDGRFGGGDYSDPILVERAERIIELAHAHGLWVKLPAVNPDQVETVLRWGADWFTLSDDPIYGRALRSGLKMARETVAEYEKAAVAAS